jgi:YVTN family beta-propeller protein
VIRTATNKIVATVTVGIMPSGIAVSPDGALADVAHAGSNNVSVLDTATLVGTPVPVGTLPLRVAFSLDGKHAYVANGGSGDVSVICTAKKKVVATVAVGTDPFGVPIMP